jgi:hypothetical protein
MIVFSVMLELLPVELIFLKQNKTKQTFKVGNTNMVVNYKVIWFTQ